MNINTLSTSPANYSTAINSAASNAPIDSDGDNDGSRAVGRHNGGQLASALQSALSQLGIATSNSGSPASSTASTVGTGNAAGSDPQQALQSFTQMLYQALHSQVSSQSNASGTQDASAQYGHHHHQGGETRLASSLQSLAQQVDGGNTSGNPNVAALQSSFNALLVANGKSDASLSLSSVLGALGQGLQGSGTSGAIASTSV